MPHQRRAAAWTEEIKRLRLGVGLTDYFTMRVTNSSMD